MSVTRAEVLKALRRLGYAVGTADLAMIMDAPSYAVNKALQGLYWTDKIDRQPRLINGREYLYRAKELNA